MPKAPHTPIRRLLILALALTLLATVACGPDRSGQGGNNGGGNNGGGNNGGGNNGGGNNGGGNNGGSNNGGGNNNGGMLPAPACAAAGGTATVAVPTLRVELGDRWHEAWLGSPAVADLDGDGVKEIIAARGNLVLGWRLDGEVVFRAETDGGRIWASPVVADLRPDVEGLEVAVASREAIHVFDARGAEVSGFPFRWQDELRSLAAGDLDGDGTLELVAVSTSRLEANGQRDILIAVHADGRVVEGFPPNTTGAARCDEACYVTGGPRSEPRGGRSRWGWGGRGVCDPGQRLPEPA